MRRLKFVVLAASVCALAACSPPGQKDSDQLGGTPSRGPVAGQSSADADGSTGTTEQAADLSALPESGGRYNLINDHLVEGTVELRHDGNGTSAVTAENFGTQLPDGTYTLRGYDISSCQAISAQSQDLGTLGQLTVSGNQGSVSPRAAKADPLQILTIAAVKDGDVAACGPWIKWVGDKQPTSSNGAG